LFLLEEASYLRFCTYKLIAPTKADPVWETWLVFLNLKLLIWRNKVHTFNFPSVYSSLNKTIPNKVG